jgi:hypothetical protein
VETTLSTTVSTIQNAIWLFNPPPTLKLFTHLHTTLLNLSVIIFNPNLLSKPPITTAGFAIDNFKTFLRFKLFQAKPPPPFDSVIHLKSFASS